MELMSFWEGALKGGAIVFFKRLLVYVKAQFGEPVFWIIVGTVIVLAIVGFILSKKEEQNKKENLSKGVRRSSDGQVICPRCKGYGELESKGNQAPQSTTCPRCLGTGWVDE